MLTTTFFPDVARRCRTGLTDLRSGLAGALIGVPQEINYGLIAFAPLGLAFAGAGVAAAFFGSALAALIFVLMGAGRGHVIGPRPTLSVLVAGLLSGLLASGVSPAAAPAAIVAAMAVAGLVLLATAWLGLGQLVKYLPLPVLAGFTNGVAAILALSALPMALGIGQGVAVSWADFRPSCVLIALVTVVISLYPIRLQVVRSVPAMLQALIVAIALNEAIALWAPDQAGLRIGQLVTHSPDLGELLATLTWPDFDGVAWLLILKFGLALALAAALETLAVAGIVDAQTGQRSATQVVIRRLGLTYLLFAPLMMPVAGSLGRSSALLATGAQTRAAQVFYAVFLMALITWGYAFVAQLPQAAIAGVLIVVARGMVGQTLHQAVADCRHALAPHDRRRALGDLGVMLIVALITVGYSFMVGLAVGVVAAMILFIRDQSRAAVRRVQLGDRCRSLRMRSGPARALQAQYGQEIAVIEAEGALFFGSAELLLSRVDALAGQVRDLIVDLRRVSDIDLTACRLIAQAARRCRQQGCRLMLSHLPASRRLYAQLLARGLADDVPERDWFADLDAALEAAENRLLARHGLAVDAMTGVALAASDLAHGMTADDVEVLAGYLRPMTLPAGEILFRQGDPGRSLFVITRGALSIRLPTTPAAGSQRLVAFGPGAVLGEMALISGAPRSANALADEDSELLELDAAAFDALSASHPATAIALLRTLASLLSDRLRSTTTQLRDLTSE